ncbi:MAG: 50S ribosomal protein L18 [Planctomycetes bacterium]|nr:50S ribosomal protein L18 [Planctomycetota bacterium]
MMKVAKRIATQRQRRRFRVRNHVRQAAHGRPRLCIFRSNRHIYAQLIDDDHGRTLVAASTLEKDVSGPGSYAGNKDAAVKVGGLLAQRALEKGIKEVVFDRGKYKYHGRVQALADSAREKGLEF